MEQASLQINDLVRVQVLEGEVREAHASRIEDLARDSVTIAWPTDRGELVPIVAGQPLLISFIRGSRFYTLAGEVRATALTPIPIAVVQVRSEPQRLERRDNVRIRAAVRLELRERVVSISEFRSHNERGLIRTSTVDLSGGGFSIRHPAYVAIGLPFEATLSLPDKKEPLTIAAKVVRCSRVPGSVGEEYEVGFAYERISESIRSRIVRFVFTAQLSEIQHDPVDGRTAGGETHRLAPPEAD